MFDIDKFRKFATSSENKCVRDVRHNRGDGFYSSYTIASYVGGSTGNSGIMAKIDVRLKSGKIPQHMATPREPYCDGSFEVRPSYPKRVRFVHESLVYTLIPPEAFSLSFSNTDDLDKFLKNCVSDCGGWVSARKMYLYSGTRYCVISKWVRKINIKYKEISIDRCRGRDLLIPIDIFINRFSPDNKFKFSSNYKTVESEDNELNIDDWVYGSYEDAQNCHDYLRIINNSDVDILASILKPHIGKSELGSIEDVFIVKDNHRIVESGVEKSVPSVFLSHKAELLVRQFMIGWLRQNQKAPNKIES